MRGQLVPPLEGKKENERELTCTVCKQRFVPTTPQQTKTCGSGSCRKEQYRVARNNRRRERRAAAGKKQRQPCRPAIEPGSKGIIYLQTGEDVDVLKRATGMYYVLLKSAGTTAWVPRHAIDPKPAAEAVAPSQPDIDAPMGEEDFAELMAEISQPQKIQRPRRVMFSGGWE